MSDVDTKAKRRNKRWPEALKREIVAASIAPGASVSVVARQYDVNANQVFSWRRRYRAAEQPPTLTRSMPGLVPVKSRASPFVRSGELMDIVHTINWRRSAASATIAR
jgi:transposase-like protein